MDVDVIAFHRLLNFCRQEIVVNEGFGGFTGKFHHHTRRRVCVHVGILARDIIIFRFDDLEKYIASLGATCDASLVAIGYIALRYILAR